MLIPGEKIIGKFIRRVNRFLVEVDIDGERAYANLTDSGRLRELLVKGRRILLLSKKNNRRKTNYDVLAVEHGNMWIFLYPRYHSNIVEELIEKNQIEELGGCSVEKKEPRVDGSRLDFKLRCSGMETYLEVKGCTLVVHGIGLFPDAPTERGRRHLEKLIQLVKRGFSSYLFFLVMRTDARLVTANWITDPLFARLLEEALSIGVKPLAYAFKFDGENLEVFRNLPVVPPNRINIELRHRIERELIEMNIF